LVTYFQSLFDKRPHYVTTQSLLKSIKEGPKCKDLIALIRATSDKEQQDKLKKQLPVICWGGKFKERRIEGLIEASGFIVLDLDDVDVVVRKKALAVLPFVYAIFVSPTGTGLKVLVRISTENYLGHFKALSKEIEDCDESGKDISRACFMSYDKDTYVNEKADVYNKVLESAYTDEQRYEKLKTWLEKRGDKFVQGNRNNFLAKLAGACNRFGLSKDFVKKVFLTDFCKGGEFEEREAMGIIDSMYKREEEHNTASFDEAYSEKSVVAILSGQIKTNDTIYLKDVADDLIRDYEEGTKLAPTTYFPSIDAIFRPLAGDLNVLCGIGNHGKSAFKKQLDLATSVKEGRRHAYFSPEEYPPLFWYRELIRAYIGKPIEQHDPRRMTLAEYKKGMEFVKEHFVFIYPPTLPTPDYILERFGESIVKDGIRSLTLDPWNQLNHVMEKRDDIYLGEVLSKFERFAQQYGVYFTVVCHPNKTMKDSEGNYSCPDIYDLNGGAVWNARATNICVLHRPNWGTDKSDPTVEFHSKKIKRQMLSGIPGLATLNYDRRTGRYYDNGTNPMMNI
jgi:hypothetical protein